MSVSSRKTTTVTSEYKVGEGDANSTVRKSHFCSSSTDGKETCWGSAVFKLLVCFLCGMVFGIALHKAHVMDPGVIRRQMSMQQFTMLKFFLSALATSMFTLSMLAMLPFTSGAFSMVCNDYFVKMKGHSIASSIIGGAFMGLGMTVSGSCPVSIFPQLGSMVPNSYYTFLGALLGVLVYCLTKELLDNHLKPSRPHSSNPWVNSSYFIYALPIVAVLVITALAFESLIPSESEIKFRGKADGSVMAYNVWPPYVGGMLMGGLQLPLVLVMRETLGGSSSVSAMVGQLFVGPLEKMSPYAAKFRCWSVSSLWQILYVLGAVLGGYLSASMSHTLGQAEGVSVSASFWGGFFLFIGARIGGGCTSGNGVSGIGLLSIVSFIMIAATFASGMTSAFLLHWLKLL